MIRAASNQINQKIYAQLWEEIELPKLLNQKEREK
jgi:hypothetical protein